MRRCIVFPDDRVLVGIINRKTDLTYLLQEHWYRIPQVQMPDGIYAEYLAFFLSGTAAKDMPQSGIYYFARRNGLELKYRKDLLPNETSKKAMSRADEVYYKIQFQKIDQKYPPITNPTKRRFAFIHTTWDRFIKGATLADLYSKNDYYVDRIYHALRDKNIRSDRYWDAQRKRTGYGANIRVLCEGGTFTGYTEREFDDQNGVYMDSDQPIDMIFEEIRSKMAQLGGPISLPLSTTF